MEKWRAYRRLVVLGSAVAAVTVVGTVAVVSTVGQQLQIQRQVIIRNGVVFTGQAVADPSAETVYVPDSGRAVEQLRLADRLVGQKEWGKAAEVYQEVVDQFGDRVLPVPPAEGAQTTRYVTVTRRVEAQIAAFPPEGLAAYRSRYEAGAREMLKASLGDGETLPSGTGLNDVVERYFATSAGLEAGVRLADMRLENGEFAGALELLQRLLATHPDVDLREVKPARDAGAAAGFDRPALLARTVLAAGWAGNKDASDAARKELTEKFASARGYFGGREVVLSEAVAGMTIAVPSVGARLPDWVMPGGDATRSRVSAAEARASARVGVIDLPELVTQRPLNPNQQFIQQQMGGQMPPAEGAVIYPSIALRAHEGGAPDGELFFQDGSRVWGVSLDSGLPLPGWANSYPSSAVAGASASASRAGVFALPQVQSRVSNYEYSVTVTADSVLAVMGYGQVVNTNGQQEGPTIRLVRLDRTTGKKIWEVAPADFKGDQAGLTSLEMSGAPVVLGDSVYVAARGSKGNQFNDAYVMCYDYGSGKLKWSSYVASAPGAIVNNWEAPPTPATVSHLAASTASGGGGGKIYTQTNLGAIAAVDMTTGRPDWITLYPREAPAEYGGMGRRAMMQYGVNPDKPWQYNAPIVKGGLLFSLPTDAKEALVIDAATGEIRARVPCEQPTGLDRKEKFDTLVYADETTLVVAGDTTMWSFDWRKAMVGAPASTDPQGAVNWRAAYGGMTLRGRPFVARAATGGPTAAPAAHGQQVVVVPTTGKLRWIDLKGGKAVSSLPPSPDENWKGTEGQGNVVIGGDHVVIATPSRVEIWTDMDTAESRFKREMEAAPTDPLPRLTWAEVMFNAGREEEAYKLLEEAAALAKPGAQGATEKARGRLYTAAMAMADVTLHRATELASKQATAPRAEPERLATLMLFDRAAAAAQTPAQQVEWRRQKARVLAGNAIPMGGSDLAAAVALWQQILDDDTYRPVMVAEATVNGPGPASQMAEREIADAIKKSMRIYAPYEAKAAEAASAATSPAALQKIAVQYPNAPAAPAALFTAAQQLEASGDKRTASRVLRELFFHFQNYDRRAEVLESIARVSLSTPGRQDVALSRLALAARAYPDWKIKAALLFPDGTQLAGTNFAEAAEALRGRVASAYMESLPDLKLPDYAATEAHRRATTRKAIAALVEVPEAKVKSVIRVVEPADNARSKNRVVVQLAGGQMSCVRPPDANGAGTVEWTARSPGALSTGCAWFGETLVVWDANALVGVDAAAGGKQQWRVELSSLPRAEQIAGPAEALADEGGRVAQLQEIPAVNAMLAQRIRVNVANRAVAVRGVAGIGGLNAIGGVIAGRGGIIPAGNVAPPLAAEQIDKVQVCGDRLALTTSTGRVAVLSAADGRMLWQLRPFNGGGAQMVVSEDFVVIRVGEESGQHIFAMSADTGELIWRGRFSLGNPGGFPQNMALASDGTLLYTLAGSICGKDLFEPGTSLSFQTPDDKALPFEGLDGPGQLFAWEGLLLAVANRGQFVRAYSIANGCQPLRFPASSLDAAMPTGVRYLPNNNGNNNNEAAGVKMQAVGKHLYVLAPHTISSYDLTTGIADWQKVLEDSAGTYASMAVTRNFVLAQTTGRKRPKSNSWESRLQALMTTVGNERGQESGLCLHELNLTDLPAGDMPPPAAIQPTDGGLFYLATSAELKFMRGTAGDK